MKIVIIGAGGQGRVVLDILRNNHQFEVIGFLDSDRSLHGKYVDKVPVLGDMSLLETFSTRGIGGTIVAIGDNNVRCQFARIINSHGINLINAIHPSATIAQNANIGKNVVIAQGANICAHVTIEDSVICNTGCIIEHESYIHEGAHICPGVKLAGHVTVEQRAFVGIGSTVIQNITLGEASVVGAGAVVLKNVAPETTVVGIPAHECSNAICSPITERENSHRDFGPTMELICNSRKRHSRRPPVAV